MKKLISVVTAAALTLSLYFLTGSATSDTAKKNDSSGINEFYDIIEYDYITKTETRKTMRYSDEVLQAIRDGSELFSPGYTPDFIESDELLETNGFRGWKKVDPTQSPHCKVIALRLGRDLTGAGGTPNAWALGTGFMVGPKTLVTAGHNMWKPLWGTVQQARAYLKQNSSAFGSTYYLPHSWMYSPNYCNNNPDDNYDYCIINMQNNIGNTVGYFGYGTSNSLLGYFTANNGYPNTDTYFQYLSFGEINSETTFLCQSPATATNGQSGGPVYTAANQIVYAIIRGGGPTHVTGVRISNTIYNEIAYMKSRP